MEVVVVFCKYCFSLMAAQRSVGSSHFNSKLWLHAVRVPTWFTYLSGSSTPLIYPEFSIAGRKVCERGWFNIAATGDSILWWRHYRHLTPSLWQLRNCNYPHSLNAISMHLAFWGIHTTKKVKGDFYRCFTVVFIEKIACLLCNNEQLFSCDSSSVSFPPLPLKRFWRSSSLNSRKKTAVGFRRSLGHWYTEFPGGGIACSPPHFASIAIA